ncbi:MAG: conjugative transposon protein TraM [Chitinophagaceae bacterium]
MKQSKEKRRKLLLMLPLFILPVVALVLLFGGNSNKASDEGQSKESAFNSRLPSANINDAGKNKLELYMEAQKDSAQKRKEAFVNPYEGGGYDPAPPTSEQEQQLAQSRLVALPQNGDGNEKKVNERLDKLMKEINRPVTKQPIQNSADENKKLDENEVEQLEKLMANLQTPGGVHDPEMSRIESVLEKVLDIQHPERIKERSAKKQISKTESLPVSTTPDKDSQSHNGFFGIQEEITVTAAQDNSTIAAMVHTDQVIQDGATIKLRLLQPVFLGDRFIPSGTFISGKCEFAGDRVNISLKEIAYNNNIYPVALNVYDMDGLMGINVPGAITRDVAKKGLSQTIQDVDIYSAGSSVAAQATSTGIQTAKNLLTKKVKAVKATIKAGHKVLLKKAN